MQTSIKIMLTVAALALASHVSAQRNKSYILKHTNVEALQQMAIGFAEEYRVKHIAAIAKALEMGWDTINLRRLDERGNPIYYSADNNGAAFITGTIALRNNLGVQGSGMVIGEWDEGWVRTTHQDLTGRVTYLDNAGDLNSHATHVAGTLIGNPPDEDNSKGMAPQATLRAFDFADDMAEMTAEAAGGMLISNHSYGSKAGWEFDETNCSGFQDKWTWHGDPALFNNPNGDDAKFGAYGGNAPMVDVICINAPFYLPVLSSGNDFDDNPNTGACNDEVRNGTAGTYEDYDPDVHPPGDGEQKSTIDDMANAKNIMTIGNVDDDLFIHDSSSRGLTDDGRIKPDICGNGTELYSADSPADDAYDKKTGTSMACPNVAGSLLLLQQAYEERNVNQGIYMRSATLKALAIHTAIDLGTYGPDATHGWGLLNANAAGSIVNQDLWQNGAQSTAVIIEDVITSANQTWTYKFNKSPSFLDRLKVTLVYTDPPGAMLVNDLDLRVRGIDYQKDYFPFVLNSSNPNAPATQGDNDADNVEQVEYFTFDTHFEVKITVEGALQNNASQPFSLIISNLNPNCQANIRHKLITPASGTYTAQESIASQATMLPGREVTYRTNGRVVLKPGFRAKAQTGSGTGFFKTATGTCN